MTDLDWKENTTTIAIFDTESIKWQFLTFDTWDEARQAVNSARSNGRAAVFYDGATLLQPPELPVKSDK